MALSRGALILLLCLSCAAAAQTVGTGKTVRRHRVQESDVAPAVSRAEAAIDKKDYAAAEQALTEAIKQNPNDYRAWFDLGFVYTATKRDPEAIAAYRKSVAANPKVFESNLNLGLMLARDKDPEAEKYLRAATALKPTAKPEEGLYRAWISLGHFLSGNKPDDALASYRKAAELKPKDPEPHLFAAREAEKANDVATAEQEYKAVLALDPKPNYDVYAGLANIYVQSKRIPEAEGVLKKLIAMRSQDPSAHLLLGRLLAGENRNDEAQAEFETALRLDPSGAAAKRDLAIVYVENSQPAKAEPLFREALLAQPNDAELHHRLGKVLLDQKKSPEAQQEFLTAVKLKPDYAIAYGDLALAASKNEDYVLTIKALDARARTLPEIPATYFLRATAYDHLRDYKQAAANYHQFLAIADGRFPDQEWQARHRLLAIEPKKK